jgi:hypothetical protein
MLIAACLLLLLPPLAEAQTRRRRGTTQRRPPAAATARPSSDAVAIGRLKLAEKIKVITEFLYVYGGIANQIEATEAQAREGGSQAELKALAERSRTALRRSLTGVRDGLDQLELEFRTSPDLQRYYNRVAGVAAGAADAEELAASNQLKPAGRKLLLIVSQLTDALAAMN